MSKQLSKDPAVPEKFHVRFNLAGLVIFSAALVLASGLLAFSLERASSKALSRWLLPIAEAGTVAAPVVPAEIPPWGELKTAEVGLERPEEYIAPRANSRRIAPWIFAGQSPETVRSVLVNAGLSPEQVQTALSPQCLSVKEGRTIIQPSAELVLGLAPEARARLYRELGRNPANEYMKFPLTFTPQSFEAAVVDCQLDPAIAARVRSLAYHRGDTVYFSDVEAALQLIPTEEQRLRLVMSLSRQNTVLVRLQVRPGTDIDKLVSYWTGMPGVRVTNLRPLLESLQRLPEGGTISMLYLLPRFARERLYTFPLSTAAESKMDCAWSSMNFFNETPDDRFSESSYVTSYLAEHYYEVEKATRYGDLVLIADDHQVLHMAVYLADDLVFTKNGANYMQPWTIMHLKDLMAVFSVPDEAHLRIYRNKQF
ncbi:MAG: hypothetical protein U1F98_05660 [Verrucomicrobiota bacterium]